MNTTFEHEPNELRERRLSDLKRCEWKDVAILCSMAALCYADRYTTAIVLHDVQDYYDIDDDKAGLLQTAFIFSFTMFSPVAGFLGDRINKKFVIIFGVSLWNTSTLIGSFMTKYWWFLATRALIGIGQVFVIILAPTVICDMVTGKVQSKLLSLFYVSAMLGSGLGYALGAVITKGVGLHWQWSLRFTPSIGLLLILLIILNYFDKDNVKISNHIKTTSFCTDVRCIGCNKSYAFTTMGFTCTSFVIGSYSWWCPKFIALAIETAEKSPVFYKTVGYVFGTLVIAAGLIGVPTGPYIANRLRYKWPRIDVIICATAMFMGSPCSFLLCFLAQHSILACYTFLFLTMFSFSLLLAVDVFVMVCVTMPERRSTALGFRLFTSQMFGAVMSPFLIGAISRRLKQSLVEKNDKQKSFLSLQLALYTNAAVFLMGGTLYLFAVCFFIKDKDLVDKFLAEDSKRQSTLTR